MAEQETIFKRIATTITTVTAVMAVFISGWQASNLHRQHQIDGDQTKRQRTHELAIAYLNNSHLADAESRIRERTLKQGISDYTSAQTDGALRNDILEILNYLETIATGTQEGFYSEQILQGHFKAMVLKAVRAFIEGESGEVDGEKWISAGSLWPESTFPNLVKLYKSWSN
jgi:hypothetical protein